MFSKKKHISVCGPTCPAPKVTSVLALLLLPSIQALPLRWPVLALLLRTSVHVPQPTFSFFFFFFHLMAHNQHVDYSGIYFQSGYVNYFPWISGKGKTTKHRVQTVYLITTQSWILSHKYIREMQLSVSTFFSWPCCDLEERLRLPKAARRCHSSTSTTTMKSFTSDISMELKFSVWRFVTQPVSHTDSKHGA